MTPAPAHAASSSIGIEDASFGAIPVGASESMRGGKKRIFVPPTPIEVYISFSPSFVVRIRERFTSVANGRPIAYLG